jgi:hypothetical protein
VGFIAFSEAEARQELTDDGSLEHKAEGVRNTVGGRINLETPIAGLLAGASGYTGQEDEGRHSAFGAHLEYDSGVWSVRTEMARHREDGGVSATAFYAEGARRVGRWEVSLRHDRSDTDLGDEGDAPDSFRRHRDTALGLNYWFTANFVLKASYHRVDGNRFARPDADDADGRLEPRTDMVVVGAQFSF